MAWRHTLKAIKEKLQLINNNYMGMYTQIHFASELKKDTPEIVLDVLSYMAGNTKNKPNKLPTHKLFTTSRWGGLMTMSSYYFDYKTQADFYLDSIAGGYYLSFTSNLKNYGSEIENFIDWIDPYLMKSKGEFLGYSRYEETEEPTLIYKK